MNGTVWNEMSGYLNIRPFCNLRTAGKAFGSAPIENIFDGHPFSTQISYICVDISFKEKPHFLGFFV